MKHHTVHMQVIQRRILKSALEPWQRDRGGTQEAEYDLASKGKGPRLLTSVYNLYNKVANANKNVDHKNSKF